VLESQVVALIKGGVDNKRGEAMERVCAGVLHVAASEDPEEWKHQEEIW